MVTLEAILPIWGPSVRIGPDHKPIVDSLPVETVGQEKQCTCTLERIAGLVIR